MGSDTTRHDNGTGTGTGTTMFRICWQKHTTLGGSGLGRGEFTGTGAHGKGFPYVLSRPALSNYQMDSASEISGHVK